MKVFELTQERVPIVAKFSVPSNRIGGIMMGHMGS